MLHRQFYISRALFWDIWEMNRESPFQKGDLTVDKFGLALMPDKGNDGYMFPFVASFLKISS